MYYHGRFTLRATCKFLVIALLFFTQTNAHSRTPAEIRVFDLRFYNLKSAGVKDLAFEMRIEGLKDHIEEITGLTNLIDLYFQIYWTDSDGFHVRIAGLPAEGFYTIRNQLMALAQERLELVIATPLEERLKGLNFKSENHQGKTRITATDPTQKSDISRILLDFSRDGRLVRMRTEAPIGHSESTIALSPKSWSNNKWVIDGMDIVRQEGVNNLEIKKVVNYQDIEGFGVPSRVRINTIRSIAGAEEGAESSAEHRVEDQAIIQFSNYRINTGAARQVMPSPN